MLNHLRWYDCPRRGAEHVPHIVCGYRAEGEILLCSGCMRTHLGEGVAPDITDSFEKVCKRGCGRTFLLDDPTQAECGCHEGGVLL